jgi:polyhydroxyalkanoate synthesis regulator phasin
VITKEKADEAVSRLVEQGKLTADEAEQLVSELLKSGSQQWEKVQANVNEALSKALNSADIARRQDVEVILQRLEKAEQRIAMLEDAMERIPSADQS